MVGPNEHGRGFVREIVSNPTYILAEMPSGQVVNFFTRGRRKK